MTSMITVHEWMQFLDDEYLSTYIQDKGSSIKFAVVSSSSKSDLYTGIKGRCQNLDYLFIELDSSIVRVHMPQDIFFGLANQVDWRLLARRFILQLGSKVGYNIESIDPSNEANIFHSIASLNGLDPEFVLSEIRPQIQNIVYGNKELAKDFRVCMSHICLQENTRGEYNGQPLLDWLTGTNMRIGAVRPFAIYTTINRTTARFFIESALLWINIVGYTGTVLMLDDYRVTLARNPRDDLRYYTRRMAEEHYELLREFIDGADRLCSTLLVVVVNDDFVDDRGSRSYKYAPALRTRIMNDVRDRNLLNPVAPLVSLSDDEVL